MILRLSAQAKIDSLQAAIIAYSATVGSPRAATAEQTAITQAIESELARIDDVYASTLDRLILQFQADHKSFVDEYWAARVIIDPGSPSAPPPKPALTKTAA